MALTLRQMRTLVIVARTGSLGRAAVELSLSQPALSVQLREAETDVGFRLFDRGFRGAQVTEAGGGFIAALERVLTDLDEVTESAKDVAQRKAGVVRVAVLPSVGATLIPEALSILRKDSPRIRVIVRDGVAGRLADMLRSGEVEIGIGTTAATGPTISASRLFNDQLVAVLPKGHRFEAGADVRLSDLTEENLILTDPQSSVRSRFEEACLSRKLSVAPAYQATYMSTAIGLVRAGLGVAVLPSTAVELKIPPLLEVRPISDPSIHREISVMSRVGRSISPASEAFIRAIETVVASTHEHDCQGQD